MAVLNFNLNSGNPVGFRPQTFTLDSNDTLAAITTPGYLNFQSIAGVQSLKQGDIVECLYTNGSMRSTIILTANISGNTITLGGSSSVPTGYTGQQYFVENRLIDAASISWDMNTQQNAYLLLTSAVGATRVLANPTNMAAGSSGMLRVQQSSGGSNALTFGSAYATPTPVLSAANNATDLLAWYCDGTNVYFSAQTGYTP